MTGKNSENKRVFVWKNFTEWKPVLEGMFSDILTADFIDRIRQNKSRIEYHDDPIFEELANREMPSIITPEKITDFRQLYSHIRVYHGCRPVDVKSYYRDGIAPCEEMRKIQIDRFRSIFLNGEYPELTEEMLQKSVKMTHNPDIGSYFVLDDNFMIEGHGHYLIYGSEYLCGLVSNLPVENIEKYRSVLRKIGKPTILEIDLPNIIDLAPDERIRKILERILGEWMHNIAYDETRAGIFNLPWGVPKTLPPEYICSHFSPREIRDSLMGNKIYNTETGEYTERE